MKKSLVFPNIMVALDLSAMDEKLIAYSRFLVKASAAKTLRFVHVIPHFILPEPVSSSFDEMVRGEEPIQQRVERQLDNAVQSVVENEKDLKVIVDVLEGDPMDCLLNHAHEHQPELFIIGKKAISGDSGIVARRIARKTKCTVCFVTDNATTDIKRILVPVDFSETSAVALQTALWLRNQLGNIQIDVLHVVDAPMTAYKINRNHPGIINELKENAEAAFRKFLKKHKWDGADIKLTITVNDEFDVSNYVRKIAVAEKADLIIIGAKGHTLFEDLVFGSTTEKLVNLEVNLPILVVR
ncbi:MAG: universal stress protein [Saprospiraceae bacterium]|nr:universal stress protein [Saprospiraceae bacterium]MCF8248693.1 universal stress protein [Saprospiraceae bacterium]MCF8278817.1 universal stress protein [Bacteroidales bacterium]MCF8310617.1 universal stress protein [Saprospiraceae bacterium]MCF8439176.1 universal stress protein [Saprospiraceae bacterium]